MKRGLLKRTSLLIILATAVILALAGCGGKKTGTEVISETMSEPESVTIIEYASLGEKTEGSVQIKLINKFGKNIKEFVVEAEGKNPENLLKDDVFAADETRNLFYKPEEGKKYSIRIKYGVDKETVLHEFPMNGVEKMDLLLEDEIGYITYPDQKTGEDFSSLENEKKLLTQEETTTLAATPEPVYYEEPVYYPPADYGPQGDDGCIDDGLMW